MLIRLVSAAGLLAAMTVAAIAQNNGRLIATFTAWEVHVMESPQGRVCFAASRPTESNIPVGPRRSEIAFILSNRPAANVRNEAYAQMGYPLAPDSQVLITIDGTETFSMFVEDEGAWLPSAVEDDLLAAAMRGGREMVVRGRSARGNDTTDTYSLIGVSAALDRAAAECAG